LSRGHAMLHSAEETECRHKHADAAASDSLVVQSFVPVPSPLQSLETSSSPRGRSGPCVFVCVGRETLSPIAQKTSHEDLGANFYSFAKEFGVFHNDGHVGNAMHKQGHVQAIDLERASKYTADP
jgi:hypothetical protein